MHMLHALDAYRHINDTRIVFTMLCAQHDDDGNDRQGKKVKCGISVYQVYAWEYSLFWIYTNEEGVKPLPVHVQKYYNMMMVLDLVYSLAVVLFYLNVLLYHHALSSHPKNVQCYTHHQVSQHISYKQNQLI